MILLHLLDTFVHLYIDNYACYDVVQGLNFRAGWQVSCPKFRNPVKKYQEGKIPTLKNSQFSGNFCFMKWNSLFSENSLIFMHCWIIFSIPMVIFYCRQDVMVFRFYQQLNAVRSKNSELSRGISCFLQVFSELIAH